MDVISEEEKRNNFNRLVEVQNQISREINESYKDNIYEVLVDGPSKTNKNMLTGRTRTGKVVNFKGEAKIGELVNVKINEVHSFSLNGEIVINNQS